MLKAKKSLSQNFLVDKNISKKITSLTDIKNKHIVEIGPGYGFLTDMILKKKPKLIYIIEKDEELYKYLKLKYKNIKNIIIVNDDIFNFDFKKLKQIIIISNLPYNISTKIILHLFKYNKNIIEMIVMLQREVAEKFDYKIPGMNKYKFLTNVVSSFSKCFDVSADVFKPKPKVKSTVVKFKFNKEGFDINKAYKFSNLIFKNVRKKISKNINFKNKDKLLSKRVNQLNINDLTNIYNLF